MFKHATIVSFQFLQNLTFINDPTIRRYIVRNIARWKVRDVVHIWIKEYDIKAYGGLKLQYHAFLTSAQDKGV
jgi:hypothetical protein